MFLESEDPKYAFVHIPKNAGMSMANALINIPNIKSYHHGVIFENIKTFKKIFIVREPIDRFTSAFFYVKKHYVKNMFNTPEELIESIISNNNIANKFLRFQPYFHRVNGIPINTDWVFHPQSAWIHDPFKILLFEQLDHDISILNREINANIILPKINSSSRIDFKYSDDSINFLKMRYKDDFELYKNVMLSRGLHYTY